MTGLRCCPDGRRSPHYESFCAPDLVLYTSIRHLNPLQRSTQAFLRAGGPVPELSQVQAMTRRREPATFRTVGLARHEPLAHIYGRLVLSVDKLFSEPPDSIIALLQPLAIASFALEVLNVSTDFAAERLRLLRLALDVALDVVDDTRIIREQSAVEPMLEILRAFAVSVPHLLGATPPLRSAELLTLYSTRRSGSLSHLATIQLCRHHLSRTSFRASGNTLLKQGARATQVPFRSIPALWRRPAAYCCCGAGRHRLHLRRQ